MHSLYFLVLEVGGGKSLIVSKIDHVKIYKNCSKLRVKNKEQRTDY